MYQLRHLHCSFKVIFMFSYTLPYSVVLCIKKIGGVGHAIAKLNILLKK